MLKKSLILNGQETAKSRPRAPRRGPRPSWTLPKWSPRPSQERFWWDFWVFSSSSKFALIFYVFFLDFLLILKSSTLTKHCKNHGFFNVFAKSLFAKIIRKIVEKSFKNRSQIREKSRKFASKRDFEQRCAKNAKKLRKSAKIGPTWPQDPPKRRGTKTPTEYAKPCLPSKLIL